MCFVLLVSAENFSLGQDDRSLMSELMSNMIIRFAELLEDSQPEFSLACVGLSPFTVRFEFGRRDAIDATFVAAARQSMQFATKETVPSRCYGIMDNGLVLPQIILKPKES